MRLVLAVSPQLKARFSGEGRVLGALAGADVVEGAALIGEQCHQPEAARPG